MKSTVFLAYILGCVRGDYRKTPIQVDGLDSSDIVIHILATAKHVKYKKGVGNYDYVTHRMLPTVESWGRSFPRLTFVLGGESNAEVLLTETGHGDIQCEATQNATTSNQEHRQVFHSICPGFEVLRFPHCTNDYYGSHGPCCRNQESMRWVLDHDMHHLKWYAFMDDDMYIRPLPFIALLSKLLETNPKKALAVSNAPSTRGFAPGMWKWLGEKGCDSNNLCTFAFPWMQPAFFSFEAMQKFQDGINSNGLTKECDAFHVTHDVGLGIFNWMHSIPTFMLPNKAHSDVSRIGKFTPAQGASRLSPIVSIHAVRRKNGNHTLGELKGPSGLDGYYASFEALHTFYAQADTTHPGLAIELGQKIAEYKVLNLNGFNSTLIKRRAEANHLSDRFFPFTPDDCKMVDFDHAKKWCTTKADTIPTPPRPQQIQTTTDPALGEHQHHHHHLHRARGSTGATQTSLSPRRFLSSQDEEGRYRQNPLEESFSLSSDLFDAPPLLVDASSLMMVSLSSISNSVEF